MQSTVSVPTDMNRASWKPQQCKQCRYCRDLSRALALGVFVVVRVKRIKKPRGCTHYFCHEQRFHANAGDKTDVSMKRLNLENVNSLAFSLGEFMRAETNTECI